MAVERGSAQLYFMNDARGDSSLEEERISFPFRARELGARTWKLSFD
jgi:hypothetical protein